MPFPDQTNCLHDFIIMTGQVEFLMILKMNAENEKIKNFFKYCSIGIFCIATNCIGCQ